MVFNRIICQCLAASKKDTIRYFIIVFFLSIQNPQSTFTHPLLYFIKKLNRISNKKILKNPNLNPNSIFQDPFTSLS
jgi:hypothetical protein